MRGDTAPTEFARGDLDGSAWIATAHLQGGAPCLTVRYELADGPGSTSCTSGVGGLSVSAIEHPAPYSFIYGAASTAAVEVVVELTDGRVFREPTRPAPTGLTDDVHLFVIPIDGPADVARYEARVADGTVVHSHQP